MGYKLKPCPFCGRGVHIISQGIEKPKFTLLCFGIGRCNVAITSHDLESLIENWNKRHIEKKLANIIELFMRAEELAHKGKNIIKIQNLRKQGRARRLSILKKIEKSLNRKTTEE